MNNFNRELTHNIPQLRRYARALVNSFDKADDLVQDCLERACARQQLWDSKKAIRPWLFTIMHNIYANDARRFNRSPALVSWTQLEEAEVADKGLDTSLTDLKKALDCLSEDHRQVLLLVGLEQMSYRETAEILGIPLGTVMSRLTRARSNLKQFMNDPTAPRVRRIK